MKKISKKILIGTLAGTMILSSGTAAMAKNPVQSKTKVCQPVIKQQKQVIMTAFSQMNVDYYDGLKMKLFAVSTGNGKLTYTSSDENVASVNKNGLVKFKSAGEVTITIQAAETKFFKAASKKVTIKAKEKALTLKVDGKKTGADILVAEDGHYMKVDEIAAMMEDTSSAFSVAIDENNKTIYTEMGQEYVAGTVIESEAPEKAPAAWTLKIDGVNTQMVRCIENEKGVYFNVKDLSVLYGFDVNYKAKANQLKIKTGTGYSLELDAKDYETGSIQVFGETVNYRVYTAVYASNPAVVAQEVMKIYVPEGATEDSPIIMPLKTGAHQHAEVHAPFDVDETNMNAVSSGTVGTGGMEAASYLMSKGWVVATSAARGYDTITEKDGLQMRAGNAPSCITDLKASIRFLQHNDDVIPGDPDKIVVTGTSGGGTMTTIMGASGNSDFYTPYLEAIGAAEGEDDVYAAVPYCPVVDIDNQGMAYEWQFSASGARTGELGALNQTIASQYSAYLEGLQLKDAKGTLMALDAETLDGTYREYYRGLIANALTNYMYQQDFVKEDGSLNEAGQAYLDEELIAFNKSNLGYSLASIFNWNAEIGGAELPEENYAVYSNLVTKKVPYMKGCPSFDNGLLYGDLQKSSFDSINQLFNTDPFNVDGWMHWEMNLGDAVAKANAKIGSDYFRSEKGDFTVADDVQKLVAMYNAMYYVKDVAGLEEAGLKVNSYADDMYQSSDVAPFWHIRVGSWDQLVSGSSSATFALALEENPQVENVDFSLYWNQPHTGWYDNSDMVVWLQNIVK